jgi:O-antigen/teichoic acid export membrane protein
MKVVESVKTYWMNMSSSYLPFLIQILGSLFFTPFFIKVLGTDQYGLFILVNTIISYFSLCDIGFSQAFTYKIIDYFQKDDHPAINALISSVFYYFLGAGIAINILVGLFLHFNLGINLLDHKLYPYFKMGLPTLSLSFLTILLSQFFERILFAKNKIYKVNLIKSLQQLTLISLNIIILNTTKDLNLIFLNYLLVNAIFCLVMYKASITEYPYQILFSSVSYKTFSTIVNTSWWFFVGTVSYLLNFQTDVFVISSLFDLKLVAIYTIYYKFVHMFMMLLTKPAETYIPNIATKFSNNDFSKLLRDHKMMFAWITLIALAITAALLKPGYLFLQWWIGRDVINNYTLFIPFTIYFFLFSIDNVTSTFLWAMCLHKKSVLMGLANGALNLALSIYFSKFLGISGVIWGTITALLLTNFWYNLYLFKKSIHALWNKTNYENRHPHRSLS